MDRRLSKRKLFGDEDEPNSKKNKIENAEAKTEETAMTDEDKRADEEGDLSPMELSEESNKAGGVQESSLSSEALLESSPATSTRSFQSRRVEAVKHHKQKKVRAAAGKASSSDEDVEQQARPARPTRMRTRQPKQYLSDSSPSSTTSLPVWDSTPRKLHSVSSDLLAGMARLAEEEEPEEAAIQDEPENNDEDSDDRGQE